jgi:hypothetical protein
MKDIKQLWVLPRVGKDSIVGQNWGGQQEHEPGHHYICCRVHDWSTWGEEDSNVRPAWTLRLLGCSSVDILPLLSLHDYW